MRVSPSWRTEMTPGMSRASSPFGPFTLMVRSDTVTTTPLGTAMGDFPMRDMSAPRPSPDEAQDLATDAGPAGFAVGHETLAGGQDSDAEAAEDPRHTVGLGVDAE